MEDSAFHLKNWQKATSTGDKAARVTAFLHLQALDSSVDTVRARILSSDYNSPKSPAEARAIADLCHLLFYLSEDDGIALANSILVNCSSVVAAALRVWLFFFDAYSQHDFNGHTIRIHHSIVEPDEVLKLIVGWLDALPKKDLAGIECIYLTPPDQLPKHILGLYVNYAPTIVLAWPRDQPSRILSKFLFWLGARIILYHEVGHHYYRHGGLGETNVSREREYEADSYALSQMCLAYPLLRVFGPFSRHIIYFLSRKYFGTSVRVLHNNSTETDSGL